MYDHEYFVSDEDGRILTVPPIDRICRMLKRKIKDYEDKIVYYKDKVKELEDENWKDKELLKMKKEMKKYREDYLRGFPISKEEDEKINKWIDKHTKEKHNGNTYAGAIGGRYSYIFTPTGIGTFGTIKCACGDTYDFQEGW